MAIADWIREATERRRERLLRGAYMQGYADRDAGKPANPPGGSESKAEEPRDNEPRKRS